MVQCSKLGSPRSGALYGHRAGTPRPCQPHGSEEKGEKKKKERKRKYNTIKVIKKIIKIKKFKN